MAGRRGRKPQGAYSGKTTVLTTRITPDLRQNLEMAREQHPRTWSLSQEVEDRLRDSFNEDQLAGKMFKDREAYAIGLLAAQVIEQVEMVSNRHWAADVFVTRACAQAIGQILLAFRESDDATIPGHLANHYKSPEEFGSGLALGILDQLRMTDKQPLDRPGRYYTKQAKLYPRVKAALGDLMERLK